MDIRFGELICPGCCESPLVGATGCSDKPANVVDAGYSLTPPDGRWTVEAINPEGGTYDQRSQ